MTTNQQHSPDFRPDPARSIFLSETINQSTLDRLTPVILRLQADGRGPLTLFIDSPGGSVASAGTLSSLLGASDQDGNGACRLITVATGMAASAASDLLMAGDYALAYPHALILCHGVREQSRSELTHEKAIDLAKNLANSNERFAIQLADNCIHRFIFRLAFLSSEFPEIKQRRNNALLPHTECFIEALKSRVPVVLIEVLEDALKRSVDNDALDTFAAQAMAGQNTSSMPLAQFEALLLKAILDYETQQHASDARWSFRSYGFERIQDKLELLLNKYNDHHAEMTSLLCARWGEFFLTPEQETEISQLLEEERPAAIEKAVQNILRTLWFFFVSICRLLQKDDYWMTAESAYWLGLIDEVIGRTDLPCPRIFIEYPPENGNKFGEQPESNPQ